MNTMSSPPKQDPGNGRMSREEIQESTFPYHHEVNITDGGEFLDDAIRMKEQPLEETNTQETNNRL